MMTAYVKVLDHPVPTHGTNPHLSCWAALVNAWEGVEDARDEEDEAAEERAAALTDVRPFA
jgi:hypothetical protein